MAAGTQKRLTKADRRERSCRRPGVFLTSGLSARMHACGGALCSKYPRAVSSSSFLVPTKG